MEESQVRPVKTRETVWAMVVDGQGQVWSSGGCGQGVQVGGSNATSDLRCPKRPIQKTIAGLCEDGQGRIWVGTSKGRFGWIEKNRFIPLDECGTALQDHDRGILDQSTAARSRRCTLDRFIRRSTRHSTVTRMGTCTRRI